MNLKLPKKDSKLKEHCKKKKIHILIGVHLQKQLL